MTVRISASSTEFVWLPVRGEHPIDGAINVPTDFPTVEVAFTDADLSEAPDTWYAASWESSTKTISGRAYYLAQVTVGPAGDVELTEGRWSVWVRLTGAVAPIIRVDETVVVYA